MHFTKMTGVRATVLESSRMLTANPKELDTAQLIPDNPRNEVYVYHYSKLTGVAPESFHLNLPKNQRAPSIRQYSRNLFKLPLSRL